MGKPITGEDMAALRANLEKYAGDDKEKQAALLEKAAEKGDAESQYALGNIYDRGGSGVIQNHAASIAWYKKAAAQKHLRAERALARIYEKGDGVTPDVEAAVKWYSLACEHGLQSDCDAITRLTSKKAPAQAAKP